MQAIVKPPVWTNDDTPAAIITTLWDSALTNTAELTEHLQVQVADQCRLEDATASHIAQVFNYHLQRWLNTTGHPRILLEEGVVSQRAFKEARKDPASRARVFLSTITGSPFLPPEIDWIITVSLSACYLANSTERNLQFRLHFSLTPNPDPVCVPPPSSPLYSQLRSQLGTVFLRNGLDPATPTIHSCSSAVDVTVNYGLLNALLEDPFGDTDPERLTKFDSWMYQLVWDAEGARPGTVRNFSEA